MAIWIQPKVWLWSQNDYLIDIIKGVYSLRQQDGGHGSRNPLRSV